MIWSGLLIYWAYDQPYSLRIGGWTLMTFFPDWFYRLFGLAGRLPEGLAWHFMFMWPFALNGLAFAVYFFLRGHWRNVAPRKGSAREAWAVLLHDLKIKKSAPEFEGYNGAQRYAYSGILILGVLVVLSGIAILKPVSVGWLTAALGGYQFARLIHFVCMIGFCGFVLVHLAQVARAGWSNFRGMVTGYELGAGSTDEAVEVAESTI